MDCFIRGYVFSPLFLQNTSGSAAANKKQKNYVYQNSTRIFLKSNSTHKGSWWSRLVPHSVLPIFLSFFFFFKPHQAACKVLVSSCCCRRQITSVLSDSVQPHRRQPTRLLCPWDSPGKNTGEGCHFLLQCMKVKVKSLSRVRLFATPWTVAYQAPLSYATRLKNIRYKIDCRVWSHFY